MPEFIKIIDLKEFKATYKPLTEMACSVSNSGEPAKYFGIDINGGLHGICQTHFKNHPELSKQLKKSKDKKK